MSKVFPVDVLTVEHHDLGSVSKSHKGYLRDVHVLRSAVVGICQLCRGKLVLEITRKIAKILSCNIPEL